LGCLLSCSCLIWRRACCAGEDLLVASADKPFRFPATFTFVVRSFTVLDGIGKGLDPRFDISEISAPYARSLLLEAQPQFAALQANFGKRLRQQVGACHCTAQWAVRLNDFMPLWAVPLNAPLGQGMHMRSCLRASGARVALAACLGWTKRHGEALTGR
jgi:hypothetical protein